MYHSNTYLAAYPNTHISICYLIPLRPGSRTRKFSPDGNKASRNK